LKNTTCTTTSKFQLEDTIFKLPYLTTILLFFLKKLFSWIVVSCNYTRKVVTCCIAYVCILRGSFILYLVRPCQVDWCTLEKLYFSNNCYKWNSNNCFFYAKCESTKKSMIRRSFTLNIIILLLMADRLSQYSNIIMTVRTIFTNVRFMIIIIISALRKQRKCRLRSVPMHIIKSILYNGISLLSNNIIIISTYEHCSLTDDRATLQQL